MVLTENTYISYTATGQKLSYNVQRTFEDGTSSSTYKLYEGIVEYEGINSQNIEINYILHPEGRIRVSKVNDELQFTYEYHIKGHLGNTRVAFDAVPVQGGGLLEMEPLAFQYTDYYPFGLTHEQTQPSGTQGQADGQHFLFNGKEMYDNLSWLDYGARFYNPALGRWHNVDPMAEKYMTKSTYHYTGNNPVNLVDVNGMAYGDYGGATSSRSDGSEGFMDAQKEESRKSADIGYLLGKIEENGVDVDFSNSKFGMERMKSSIASSSSFMNGYPSPEELEVTMKNSAKENVYDWVQNPEVIDFLGVTPDERGQEVLSQNLLNIEITEELDEKSTRAPYSGRVTAVTTQLVKDGAIITNSHKKISLPKEYIPENTVSVFNPGYINEIPSIDLGNGYKMLFMITVTIDLTM